MSTQPSTKELNEFRSQVSAWVTSNNPTDPGFLLPQSFMEVGTEQQLEFLREWQHKVWSAGYLGMAWPKQYGGGDLPPIYQQIADEEMARQRVPIIFNTIGLGWAGPLIIDIGSEQEKATYLKGILSGEDIWCQGFSEPDHGSDLGSIQTKAVRDGDEYVINGTKIWTTHGNYAKYMILLARTNPDSESRYAGLSYFLAPMRIPGIEAHPIKKLTGEYGFNETFFTNARIPADCLMGEEGQGWKIAVRTLQYERGAAAGSAGGPSLLPITTEDLIEMTKTLRRDGQPLIQDPIVRDQLVKLIMEEQCIHLNSKRAKIPELNADYPGSLLLSKKLRGTEFSRRMRQYAVSLQGANGSLYVGDDDAIQGGFWQRAYFSNFSVTIGGGTSQIQSNIIGEHILGLAKD